MSALSSRVQSALFSAAVFTLVALALLTTGQASPPKAQTGTWGFNLADLDRSVTPCADFYSFAVGGWKKTHPIPAEYPRWGVFDEVNRHNEGILRAIVEKDARAHARFGTNRQKVGDFFFSGMNQAAIEKAGLKPIRPLLARIDSIGKPSQIGDVVGVLHTSGVAAVFEAGASPDAKNSNLVIADLAQGGLGLPGKEYYTKTDDASKKLRDQYVAYVSKMLTLLGDKGADKEAPAILALETELANGSYTRAEMRDPQKVYHRMTMRGVAHIVPHLDWAAYNRTLGLHSTDPANVDEVTFFQQLDKSLTGTPLNVWRAYLRFHVIDSLAPALPAAVEDARFDFRGRILSGTKKPLPRWKRVLHIVNHAIGEAVGEEFVRVAFPPASKEHARRMVANLRAALSADIARLDWMGPQTKAHAQEKLRLMRQKIGYPDHFRDYSALSVTRNSFVENVMRADAFETHRQIRKIGHPPDRNEWDMTPQTVNAYYDPQLNEIVFPAGILQPPFFDARADDAVNYGGIGSVIGHEMTHGFDDEGSQFDAHGNLKNWFTKEDAARFHARAKCVEDEFDGFEVEPGLHEQGKLVNGEAIADLGGVTLSWMAYQASLKKTPATPILDGFTPAQRFFLGFAQVWASNERPEYARLLTNTNPHPLPHFRVNGTVSNLPQFWAAFGCKDGDAMERTGDKRCQIW